MEGIFKKQANNLLKRANEIINSGAMFKANRNGEKINIDIPNDFKEEFFNLINKVNLSLIEDKDNFYGYFLFQMGKEIKFDISNPTGVNFKDAKYVIYFNPIIFLQLTIEEMESTIKPEIHHILAWHLIRAKELKGKFSTVAINLAMDIVVNQYLSDLPPFATTLKGINMNYELSLEPYNTFEYYAEKIQIAFD